MTNEQIETAAEKFADEIRIPASIHGVMVPFVNGLAHDSYLQGAQDALASQWVSVEEALPEYNTTCLVFGHQDFGDGRLARYTMMACYDGDDFYDAYNDRKYHPEMWMPIPAIPQLNPEKEER